jgi:hypothetical protein
MNNPGQITHFVRMAAREICYELPYALWAVGGCATSTTVLRFRPLPISPHRRPNIPVNSRLMRQSMTYI